MKTKQKDIEKVDITKRADLLVIDIAININKIIDELNKLKDRNCQCWKCTDK